MNSLTSLSPHRHTSSAPTVWRIDPDASTVDFAVEKRILAVKSRTVRGRVSALRGTVMLKDDLPVGSSVELLVDLAGVDTGLTRRDDHLRSVDYLDVAAHPLARFVGRVVDRIGLTSWRYRVDGELTLRGVARPIRLDVDYSPASARASAPRTRFVARTTLNRRDFGVGRDRFPVRVADEIRVAIILEAAPVP